MKFEIKNRFTGNILFSIETDSWKLAVEAGINAKADLSKANLSWANLSKANHSGNKNSVRYLIAHRAASFYAQVPVVGEH